MSCRSQARSATLAGSLVVALLAVPGPAHAEGTNPWWFEKTRIAQAHEETKGEGVKVAVIDGAINLDVPELDGAKIKLRGANTPEGAVGRAKSYPRAAYTAHGTSMVALIVGQGKGTNGPGIVGMAPEAEVYFYQDDPDPTDERADDIAGLFTQAVDDEVDIISISSKGEGVDDEDLRRAYDAGIVVVAAGGAAGDYALGAPANQAGVVAVGAVDTNAEVWDEQPGKTAGGLTVSAPGIKVEVGNTRGTGSDAQWESGTERTGTSPATAITAGGLALVKSTYPDATGNQLIQHMIHNVGGTDETPFFTYSTDMGFGITNVTNMLASDPTGWPDENPLMGSIQDTLDEYPLDVYQDPHAPAAEQTEAPPNDEDDAEPAAAPADDDGGMPVVGLVAGTVIVLALLAGALLILRRRRRATVDPSEGVVT